jgi:endogenous inhibitor of DNA gyrase (YacG/DUF329 family)
MDYQDVIDALAYMGLSPSKNTYVPCSGCGCNIHWKDYDQYRSGWWCSRSCAYSD